MSLKENTKTAVESYPTTMSLLRWRSSESQTAVKYLRDQIKRNIDDQTLRHILNLLLDGTTIPPALQGKIPGCQALRKLKTGGRLANLLKAARDSSPQLQGWKLNTAIGLQKYTASTKMASDPAAHGIDLGLRRKYDAAIGNWVTYKPAAANLKWAAHQDENLSVLLQLDKQEHLALINEIWEDILDLKDGNKEVRNMVDPAPQAFQSSQHLAQAFKQKGYCFRCDQREPKDVAAHGFLPLYAFRPPDEIKDTLPYNAANGIGMLKKLGMWKSNRDAVGEMTICVSRQMRGSTKFPSPGYAGPAWIYAIRLPLTQKGFDTEEWQTQVGGLWQPGEKALYRIEPASIMASVPIQKSAAQQDTEYFRFRILSKTWTWHNAQAGDKVHIQRELDSLYSNGNEQSVATNEDFLLGE